MAKGKVKASYHPRQETKMDKWITSNLEVSVQQLTAYRRDKTFANGTPSRKYTSKPQ
jgi:hypothetical protein